MQRDQSQKDQALANTAQIGRSYKNKQDTAQSERQRFVASVKEAHEAGATQLEIAEVTNYSRQRIAQFLREVNRKNGNGVHANQGG